MAAMEEARKACQAESMDLQMDRSNFIRYCIAKELKALGIEVKEKT